MFPDHIEWSDPADFLHWQAYLRQRYIRRNSHVDAHLLDESIQDALLNYRDHPERFDASRGSLTHYLWLRTRHYLDKQLQKEKRHRQREKAVGVSEKEFEKIVSEVRVRGGIYLGKDGKAQEAEERQEESVKRDKILWEILPLLPSYDRCGVYLFLLRASREEWVEHLRIEHLPREEQQDRVNREKERLRKKLKRRAQKMQGGLDLKTEHKFGQPVLTRVESVNHGGYS